MFRRYILLGLLSLIGLSSCSDKEDNKYEEQYSYTYNGCYTDQHKFTDKSEARVKEKLCQALQDDELNNFCASNLRRQRFEKSCVGMTWKPEVSTGFESEDVHEIIIENEENEEVVEDLPTTPPEIEDVVIAPEQDEQIEAVTRAIGHRFLDSKGGNIDAVSMTLNFEAFQWINECGVSANGPACLDIEVVETSGLQLLEQTQNRLVYYNRVVLQNRQSGLFTFELERQEKALKLIKVSWFDSLHGIPRNELIKEFLALPTTHKLGEYTFTQSQRSLRLLAATRTIGTLRGLYHGTKFFYEFGGDSESSEMLANLPKEQMIKQASKIIASDNLIYKEALIQLALDQYGMDLYSLE